MILSVLYFAGAWHEKWEFSAWTLGGVVICELFLWSGMADALGCVTDPLIEITASG